MPLGSLFIYNFVSTLISEIGLKFSVLDLLSTIRFDYRSYTDTIKAVNSFPLSALKQYTNMEVLYSLKIYYNIPLNCLVLVGWGLFLVWLG